MITKFDKSIQQKEQDTLINSEDLFVDEVTKTRVSDIKYFLKQIVNEQEVEEIALKSGFQKRKKEMEPFAFLVVLIAASSFSSTVFSLERKCLLFKNSFNIRPQSLQEKINREETVDFIQFILIAIIQYKMTEYLKKESEKIQKTSLFARILLQDGMVISLHNCLKKIFKGCGGSASPAALKIDAIIDLNNKNQIIATNFTSGNIPDSKNATNIFDVVKPNDLVLRDLGYLIVSNLEKLDKIGAFYISRVTPSVYIYLNKDDTDPTTILELFKKSKDGKLDMIVYLGKKKEKKLD